MTRPIGRPPFATPATDEELVKVVELAHQNDDLANTRAIVWGGKKIRCTNCGAKNDANAKFCTRCCKCIECPASE